MTRLSDQLAKNYNFEKPIGRNLLYNSNFQIAQRGAADIILPTAGTYGVDRWASVQSSTTHGTRANRRQTYLAMSRASASGFILAAQPIRFNERARLPFVAGATFTLSWDMFPDAQAGAGCRVSFAKDWVAANFEDIHTVEAIQVCPANQWTTVTTTFTLANDVVDTAMDRVLVEIGAYDHANVVPSGEKIRVRNVKLEEGNVFTGYEPTPYAVDEAECLKWYETGSYFHGSTAYQLQGQNFHFSQNLRAVKYFNPHTWTTNATGSAGVSGSRYRMTPGSGTPISSGYYKWTSSCEL